MRTGVAKDKAKDKNVVHARLKRMGKRFEISLFRDKVPSKSEIASKDFRPNWLELLSAQVVFSNAAKSELAEKSDLAEAFPDMKQEDIFKMILEKGEVLATLEDRNELQAEDKNVLLKLSTLVAGMTHSRPSQEELNEKKNNKKSKLRLERYSVADIDRELKNIKFKFDPSAPLREQAIDAIHAIHAANSFPILRDSKVVTLLVEKDVMADAKRAVETLLKPCDFKVLPGGAPDAIALLVDFSIDMADLVKKNDVLRTAALNAGDEFYVPQHTDGSDDLTDLRSGEVGKNGAAAPAAKKGAAAKKADPKGKASSIGDAKKGGKHGSDSDDDDKGPASSLEAELKALRGGDSDDERGGKKGGKGKAAKAPPKAAPKPAAQPAKTNTNQKRRGKDEFASDEEDE